MIYAVGEILLGFILLIFGAEYAVKSASAIAKKLKIPSLIIGLTVVALGTSAPEFVVSVKAAWNGSGGLSLGNIIGSNIANVLLIIGFAAVVKPIIFQGNVFIKDLNFLILVTILFVLFLLFGSLVRWEGIVLLILLVSYVLFNYFNAKRQRDIYVAEEIWASKPWWFVIFFLVIGIAGISYGADFLVQSSVYIARSLRISEEIIGLTIIAAGTSLPELAIYIMSSFKGEADIAIGNVIGSNIWNIVFIMGTTASFVNIDVPNQFINFDIWVLFGSTLLLVPLLLTKTKITRLDGIAMFLLYVVYLVAQILFSNGLLV